MRVRGESVKVVYKEVEGKDDVPVAAILNGKRPPVVYRLTQLASDELANLLESGDPDTESNIMGKV